MMTFDDKHNGNRYLENLNSKVVKELKETYKDRFEENRNQSLSKTIATLKKRFIFIIDEWDFVFRQYPDNTKLEQKNTQTTFF